MQCIVNDSQNAYISLCVFGAGHFKILQHSIRNEPHIYLIFDDAFSQMNANNFNNKYTGYVCRLQRYAIRDSSLFGQRQKYDITNLFDLIFYIQL